MKVIAVNGSPRPEGNTRLVIEEFRGYLEGEGIRSEILQAGSSPVRGCTGCNGCVRERRCVLPDGLFHEWAEEIYAADGLFIAAPVYYGSMTGQLKSFLDRLFYQDRLKGGMRHKVGGAVAILRRSGGLTTLDDLYHYFFSAEMLVAPGVGANLLHGSSPGEARGDIEGLDGLGKLARNMAWLLRMKEATRESVPPPPYERRKFMNFIRPEKGKA